MEKRSVMGAFGALAAMVGMGGFSGGVVPAIEKDEPVRHLTFGRKKMKKAVPFASRLYRHYYSPGTLVAGPARPTSAGAGMPLNEVHFTRGPQLIFSDGSFRNPGRRKLLVLKNGQVSVLSGRQFRKMRKRTRAILKATAQQAGAATA